MAGTILALSAEGESVLTGAEAVNKSYPTFYQDIKALKGDIDV